MYWGKTSEAIQFLTGMPSLKVYHSRVKEEDLWKKLSDWDKKKYILTGLVIGRDDK